MMELLYKPDWEQTKEHFHAWWAHEDFGRCGLSVTSPLQGLKPASPPAFPEKVEDRWLDFDYLHAVNDFRLSRTFFGGEAFPLWTPGYPGWDFIPSYLGAKVDLAEETGWVHPLIEKGDLSDHDCRDLTIDPGNKWWIFAEKLHKFAVAESHGKSLPGIQAIGGCGDTLAGLRSTNQLLFDVLECPEHVREFEMHLMKLWVEVYDKFYGITHEAAEGSTCWFPLWAPGRFYPLQNDFSYMISPRMFEDLFMPALEMQMKHLDYSVYHVDGIMAFAHVDAICSLPGLQALQILPGAGKPSPLHYMDVLKKVQKAGKNLHISIPCDEVETALECLSSTGLFIDTRCESEEEARTLLHLAEKWSRA
jgi:5-methyltetrahydrofolate--homocysteine methyltransferase